METQTQPQNEIKLKDRVDQLEKLIETLNKKVPVWNLFYFQGGSYPFHKTFSLDGTLRDAINEAHRHCKVMGYKFLIVRPAAATLKDQEALKMKYEDWDDSKPIPLSKEDHEQLRSK